MATKKRKPKKRARPSARPRASKEMLVQLEQRVARRVLEASVHAIRAEIRREIEPALHALWERKYASQIDRRVVDVVRSLRLRFSPARSDALFDVRTESTEQPRGGLYRTGGR